VKVIAGCEILLTQKKPSASGSAVPGGWYSARGWALRAWAGRRADPDQACGFDAGGEGQSGEAPVAVFEDGDALQRRQQLGDPLERREFTAPPQRPDLATLPQARRSEGAGEHRHDQRGRAKASPSRCTHTVH
jgi:hypothetical protein